MIIFFTHCSNDLDIVEESKVSVATPLKLCNLCKSFRSNVHMNVLICTINRHLCFLERTIVSYEYMGQYNHGSWYSSKYQYLSSIEMNYWGQFQLLLIKICYCFIVSKNSSALNLGNNFAYQA